MLDRISLEPLSLEREAEALTLVRAVFAAMVAPGFSEQGCVSFNDYLDRYAFSRRDGEGFALAAILDGVLVGVIEVVNGNHVALFFVADECRGQGVGGRLMRQALERCGQGDTAPAALTVNASPGSVRAYERLGFIVAESEQERGGIRFVPMLLPFWKPEKFASA
ncbi:GNAT family N-acetyltransferase [uncultured Pseudodesulfovibrio sp.]|uniref:GNAT family N-acetyltransferase n=1 Tax=uncultured Pseudodesulfovibrio sp. TaxID=2035858 RepID=UPI0029C7CC31|nr:GNAT family N-acetyltransferase [uncultured Pseudodesulfovibrio sp.]